MRCNATKQKEKHDITKQKHDKNKRRNGIISVKSFVSMQIGFDAVQTTGCQDIDSYTKQIYPIDIPTECIFSDI